MKSSSELKFERKFQWQRITSNERPVVFGALTMMFWKRSDTFNLMFYSNINRSAKNSQMRKNNKGTVHNMKDVCERDVLIGIPIVSRLAIVRSNRSRKLDEFIW